MKIGVFDSGIGGTTVLAALQELLPNEDYHYIADSENCPYGEKSDEELCRIVTANVEKLKAWGAKIIVVACNTATTRCIGYLRQQYPEIIFIGTEPAIKLAAQTDAKKHPSSRYARNYCLRTHQIPPRKKSKTRTKYYSASLPRVSRCY